MKKSLVLSVVVMSLLMYGCFEPDYSDARNKAEIRKLITKQQKCAEEFQKLNVEIKTRLKIQKQFKALDGIYDKVEVVNSGGIKEK